MSNATRWSDDDTILLTYYTYFHDYKLRRLVKDGSGFFLAVYEFVQDIKSYILKPG